MTSNLAGKQCQPCREGGTPLSGNQLKEYRDSLETGWEVVESHHLKKIYSFDDFAGALGFVNRIGAVAEQQGHHPDLKLSYGQVLVEIWSHKLNGLSENDFILAAKVDTLFQAE